MSFLHVPKIKAFSRHLTYVRGPETIAQVTFFDIFFRILACYLEMLSVTSLKLYYI